MSRALAPLVAGLLGLAGALGATLFLHRAAAAAVDRVLEERLAGAGATAAELLGRTGADAAVLRATMAANELEGAYVVDPALAVLADATGPAGGRADLLRLDQARVVRALAGEPSVAFAYAVGDLPVATGYFPVRDAAGAVRAVLALEAGQRFASGRATLRRALLVGIALSTLAALALALAARGFARAEARSSAAAARAARGDALATLAAMVAHEIRNPLGVIRGAADLVRARSADRLGERDREALDDVLEEVERLRRLTEDFLDLAREPAIAQVEVDLAELAADAGRALVHAHPDVALTIAVPTLVVRADPDRIRQVLSNLLENAALAGARAISVSAAPAGSAARLEVRDDGPGVDGAVRANLFEPFVSGRVRGAGLGLAISRRIAERHGGTLELADAGPPGAAFALTLPRAPG
jgi:two-component system OmpR family sensor kinase